MHIYQLLLEIFLFDCQHHYSSLQSNDNTSQSPVEQWTENACAGAPTVTRVTTYKTLTSLIQKGAGIGCLSPWFAEDDPKLKRITPIIEEATMDIWVLIHPDLRGVRRIDALKNLLIGIFDNRGKVPIAEN